MKALTFNGDDIQREENNRNTNKRPEKCEEKFQFTAIYPLVWIEFQYIIYFCIIYIELNLRVHYNRDNRHFPGWQKKFNDTHECGADISVGRVTIWIIEQGD